MGKKLVEETSTIKTTINEFEALENKTTSPVAETPKHKGTKANNEEMSRFNIYISNKQLDKIKLLAVKEHRKIKEVIEEAISLYLENK